MMGNGDGHPRDTRSAKREGGANAPPSQKVLIYAVLAIRSSASADPRKPCRDEARREPSIGHCAPLHDRKSQLSRGF